MSLQDRIKEVEQLQNAVGELVDLYNKILSSPMPPHTDFWHQSIDEKKSDIVSAYKKCKFREPGFPGTHKD